MKRYYLSTIVGTGGFTDPFRSAIADDIGQFDMQRTWGPSAPRAGDACLVLLNARSHARFLVDPRNDALPDFPFDARINALAAPALAALNNACSRRGLAVDWTNSSGFRDAVRSIGRQIEPGFDENSFDLVEG